MTDINILAIETSCDETSAAVVRNGRAVLSNVTATQIDTHKKYGGVVPEIASRMHMESISLVVDEAIERAGVRASDLDAVAVTNGPGLVGALLVGVNYAKALAFSIKIPIIGVNHIEGHVCACYLEDEVFAPPYMSLVVSGGHTCVVNVKDYGRYEVLGRTRDDAAGEAYDKAARALGLPYPGGPALEKLALTGDAGSIPFPRAWLEEGSYDFSFSGLKSAVLQLIHKRGLSGAGLNKADVAAAFQAAVIDVLVTKTMSALKRYGCAKAALVGGVAANGALRGALSTECAKNNIQLKIPAISYCTDNAAMIGSCGYFNYIRGCRDGLDLNAYPTLDL
ncbi:MAG: tRNA (adenosine(37)-N6)-threonylcarbamoyltransferase complex transferase subunit TsaD [Clostridiales bacterium]|jgi:N6-L-threonylcarbamoyladenine synthase|nr:tRNA (adenosine(37)-N6)-threonylcarbamoyltransferase complex transferase subunit TsaD [Clostridiales bacterium]